MTVLLNQLGTSLHDELKSDGFARPGSATLVRATPHRIDYVLVGSRQDSSHGAEKCSVNVGMRFPSLDPLLDPHQEGEQGPVFSCPIHLLMENCEFVEWPLEPPQWAATRNSILHVIRHGALPFFETFGSVDAWAARLSAEDPSRWFAMSPTQRSRVLAACLVVLHRPDEALSFLERELRRNEHRLPKYRIPLEQLYRQILDRRSFG